jgi:hypothetical protein
MLPPHDQKVLLPPPPPPPSSSLLLLTSPQAHLIIKNNDDEEEEEVTLECDAKVLNSLPHSYFESYHPIELKNVFLMTMSGLFSSLLFF